MFSVFAQCANWFPLRFLTEGWKWQLDWIKPFNIWRSSSPSPVNVFFSNVSRPCFAACPPELQQALQVLSRCLFLLGLKNVCNVFSEMTIDNIYDVYTLIYIYRGYKRHYMFAWFLVEFLEMLQWERTEILGPGPARSPAEDVRRCRPGRKKRFVSRCLRN